MELVTDEFVQCTRRFAGSASAWVPTTPTLSPRSVWYEIALHLRDADSGKAWHHIIFNTRGSWLTGDPRGFRSRNHRKHSDGDYKSPPPTGQHKGLHRVVRENSRSAVKLPTPLFEPIGLAVLEKCHDQAHRVLAISVDTHHVHLLVELPADRRVVKQVVGSWKQKASHAVRQQMPGTIWSKSCDPIVIRDKSHHQRTYQYILEHDMQGAWVWSYCDQEKQIPDASRTQRRRRTMLHVINKRRR